MKILVVDDEYLVRYTLARILRGNGFEVATAADGASGMAVFRSAEPDLVITDIIMPEQEGIETIRLMRRERPAVKIIAMSGSAMMMNVDGLATALDSGASDVIVKPFDAEDLLSRVMQVLGL
jgi:CheY-like chemotaxis protein